MMSLLLTISFALLLLTDLAQAFTSISTNVRTICTKNVVVQRTTRSLMSSSFRNHQARLFVSRTATCLHDSLVNSLTESLGDIDTEALAESVSQTLQDTVSDVSSAAASFAVPDMSSMNSIEALQDIPVALATIGGVVVAVVLLGAATVANSNKDAGGSSSRSRSSDVTIPYHAAARAAYDSWCRDHNAVFNEEGFVSFQTMYESKAIADVKAKRLARDLERFQNQAPPAIQSPPARKVVQETTTKKEEGLFFADVVPN